MRTLASLGILLGLTSFFSLQPSATTAAAEPEQAQDGKDLVKMKILDVVSAEDGEVNAVLLVPTDEAEPMLPVFADRESVAAIVARIHADRTPMPLPADMADELVAAFGGTVVKVVIDGVHPSALTGEAIVRHGKTLQHVHGRVQDLMALAITQKAPIYAQRELLMSIGLTKDEMRKAADKAHEDAGPGIGGSGVGGSGMDEGIKL